MERYFLHLSKVCIKAKISMCEDETQRCDHSNESYWAVLFISFFNQWTNPYCATILMTVISCGTVYCAVQSGSAGETLVCDDLNESFWADLSCDSNYYIKITDKIRNVSIQLKAAVLSQGAICSLLCSIYDESWYF